MAPCETRVVVLPLRRPWTEAVAAHTALARADLLVLVEQRGAFRESLRTLLRRTDCDLLLLPREQPA